MWQEIPVICLSFTFNCLIKFQEDVIGVFENMDAEFICKDKGNQFMFTEEDLVSNV